MAWRKLNVSAGRRAAKDGLKVDQSNKRMHATRDTADFIYHQRGRRARDARR
ncbi:MAG: hypothetical protein M3362_01865 [Acidobacteriota bacterium]|nr:hypothetical protein [Acidobacteriota bacterium]